jgi:hypothetical protein
MSMTNQGTLPVDNTFASQPGGFELSAHAGSTSPGAQGVGANLAVSHAILVVIGTAFLGLVALGIVFRRGGE